MRLFLLAPFASLALSGCFVAVPETVYSPCHASGSAGWRAWVETWKTSHGKPLTRRNLVVTGTVTVPTGGYSVRLEPGPIQRIRPRTQQIMVRTTPPREGATQALVTHNVSGSFKLPKRVERLAIRCGDGTLGIVPIEGLPAPKRRRRG
ncbi:MAG TPA: hypothetical protein VF727_00685 [Allosphingosinicella sp.]|jgi:hypothetical protein